MGGGFRGQAFSPALSNGSVFTAFSKEDTVLAELKCVLMRNGCFQQSVQPVAIAGSPQGEAACLLLKAEIPTAGSVSLPAYTPGFEHF